MERAFPQLSSLATVLTTTAAHVNRLARFGLVVIFAAHVNRLARIGLVVIIFAARALLFAVSGPRAIASLREYPIAVMLLDLIEDRNPRAHHPQGRVLASR